MKTIGLIVLLMLAIGCHRDTSFDKKTLDAFLSDEMSIDSVEVSLLGATNFATHKLEGERMRVLFRELNETNRIEVANNERRSGCGWIKLNAKTNVLTISLFEDGTASMGDYYFVGKIGLKIK